MKRKDSILATAERIVAELQKQPRHAWTGLIAMALTGFREHVRDETLLASLEILRAIADGNSFHSLGEIKVGDEFVMDAADRLLKRLTHAR